MPYVCRIESCPECDRATPGHRCKCYDLESQYERYPDGCPCGNEAKWEPEDSICNKCLHSKVCKNRWLNLTECDDFKDEGNFLEMPCPVGTILYRVTWLTKKAQKRNPNNDKGFINKYVVVGAHLKDERSRRNIEREEYLVVREINYGYSHHVPFSMIGKNTFLNYQDAVECLKRGYEL